MSKKKNTVLLSMPSEDYSDAATRIVEEIKKQLPDMAEVAVLRSELLELKREMEYTLPIVEDHRKLVAAMKNASAIAETLKKHSEILKDFDERILQIGNLCQTTQTQLQQVQSTLQVALTMKYGSGPTAV